MIKNTIYDIFKELERNGVSEKELHHALCGLGVLSEEVKKISKAYTTWLNCPLDKPENYNFVYYLNGIFVLMPFRVKKYDKVGRLVGIEIGDGLVYTAHSADCVIASNINKCIEESKAALLQYNLHCSTMPDIQLRLPTAEEALKLFKKTYDDIRVRNEIGSSISNTWITPTTKDKEKTVAVRDKFGNRFYSRSFRPEAETKAYVNLVFSLREIDFIGQLDEFGIPTPETVAMYQKLVKSF